MSSSRDAGATFAAAVRVNAAPEAIDANGESRPKIALGPRGELYVSYTRKLATPYSGEIRFSRSTDGGRTFTPPITVNDDGLETGHRFDALAVGPDGQITLAWIDKRDRERAGSTPYEGAALYYAVSADGGRTFSANRKIKDHVCECCRLALTYAGPDPLLLWRDILEGGIRDHSLVRLEGTRTGLTPRRATFDGWQIDGCPHHGPALAAGAGGVLHIAWFTGAGPRGAGLFYARSTDGGTSYSEPLQLGAGRAAGRPQILVRGPRVIVAWKEGRPEGAAILAMGSTDGGLTWDAPREVAQTQADSDQPFLAADARRPFLSWFSSREGYRLMPLEEPRSLSQARPSRP